MSYEKYTSSVIEELMVTEQQFLQRHMIGHRQTNDGCTTMSSLGSHVGKQSSAYGWPGGFSPGSPVFAHLWWTIGSI